MTRLRILTFNVLSEHHLKSINPLIKNKYIIDFLKSIDHDIIVLQEVSLLLIEKMIMGHTIVKTNLKENNIVLLTKLQVVSSNILKFNNHKHFIIVELKLNDIILNVVCVHLTSDAQPLSKFKRLEQLCYIKKELSKLSSKNSIIVGDFNEDLLTIPFFEEYIDVNNIGFTFDPETNPITTSLTENRLRHLYDRVLVSSNIKTLYSNIIKKEIKSDHYPYECVLEITDKWIESKKIIKSSAIIPIPLKYHEKIINIRRKYDKLYESFICCPQIELCTENYSFVELKKILEIQLDDYDKKDLKLNFKNIENIDGVSYLTGSCDEIPLLYNLKIRLGTDVKDVKDLEISFVLDKICFTDNSTKIYPTFRDAILFDQSIKGFKNCIRNVFPSADKIILGDIFLLDDNKDKELFKLFNPTKLNVIIFGKDSLKDKFYEMEMSGYFKKVDICGGYSRVLTMDNRIVHIYYSRPGEMKYDTGLYEEFLYIRDVITKMNKMELYIKCLSILVGKCKELNIYGEEYGYLDITHLAIMTAKFFIEVKFKDFLTEFFDYYSKWNYRKPIVLDNKAGACKQKNQIMIVGKSCAPYDNTIKIMNQCIFNVLINRFKGVGGCAMKEIVITADNDDAILWFNVNFKRLIPIIEVVPDARWDGLTYRFFIGSKKRDCDMVTELLDKMRELWKSNIKGV
jgi:endonuclease/exonuclease/phosphatase family metal-dependent hydrolase